uniref:WD repeat domain-containing protein 83 n=1 Tax=Micrurus carvalhoi TaxID=3147026 RepID=A0A2H6NC39_9SAUR
MAFPEPKPKKPELPQKLLATLECKQGAIRAVRFNVDGNYCLTCGSDKSLKLWNPHKRTLLKTYCGHGYEVLDAAGSFDNSQLCSCGADKTVVLWDVATGQVIRKFRGHAGVRCILSFGVLGK